MRFVCHSPQIIHEMLHAIGFKDLFDLIEEVPADIRIQDKWNGPGLSESLIRQKYRETGKRNVTLLDVDSYLGGGAYEHFIPAVVDHLVSRPEFVTSYTQYQPESNQGMLQALFEFQTYICRLTGMDVANASHYDGATILAEAVAICLRRKKGKILYSSFLHPFYKQVLKTYFPEDTEMFCEIAVEDGVFDFDNLAQEDISGLVVQSPNFLGMIEDVEKASKWVHQKGGLLIAHVNPVSLGLLESPGALGADIVTGEGQPLGNPLSFGGPYFGFMGVKKEFMRQIPGRIVGMTEDGQKRPGYVLTLQAREQHIRREKATSNICTNEALCALRASVYLSYLGERGFVNVSRECFQKAHFLQKELCKIPGIELLFFRPFFNEFCIRIEGKRVEEISSRLKDNKIVGGVPVGFYYPLLKNSLLIAVTETKSIEKLEKYVSAMKEIMNS